MTYIAVPDTAYSLPARGWRAVFTPRGQVLSWVISGLVFNASQYWLIQNFWVVAVLPLFVHALWGAYLVVWLWLYARRQSHWSAAAMLMLLPAFWMFGTTISVMAARPMFEAVLSDIAAGRIKEPNRYGANAHGVQYSFYADRPGLVAFDWIRGMPDGGVSIVYDDRDSIGRISSKDWWIAPSLSGLLVGRLESCQRIADPHYYICEFS